jgi:hypothetical protein
MQAADIVAPGTFAHMEAALPRFFHDPAGEDLDLPKFDRRFRKHEIPRILGSAALAKWRYEASRFQIFVDQRRIAIPSPSIAACCAKADESKTGPLSTSMPVTPAWSQVFQSSRELSI